MKCKCLVPKNKRRNVSNTYSIGHLSVEEQEAWAKFYKKDLSEYELCGGNLKAIVRAVEEPYFGGMSAELDVHFTCDKCKVDYHPYLPDRHTIEEFLTKIVEEL